MTLQFLVGTISSIGMSELFTVESEPVNNIRRQTLNGREYVVADVIMLKEGVLSGSKGPLFYPSEEIAANPGLWNTTPLTYNHPTLNNKPVSIKSPDVWDKFFLGFVFNDTYDSATKTRKAEAWYDVQVCNRVDARIIPSILNGKKINVSTGLFTSDDKAVENSVHNGKPYTHIARNYRADHLATLLDDLGACSVKDGCGININSSSIDENKLVAVGKWLSKNGAMPGYGQIFVKGSAVWYVGGDGDEWSEKNLPVKKFKEVEGVSDVRYEAEGFPPKDDGWLKINSFSPEDSMNERKDIVTFLTTNCDCWKGKEAVLNDEKSFTTDDLKKLKANTEASTLAINTLKTVGETINIPKDAKLSDIAGLVKNAMSKKECEDMTEEDKKKKMAMNEEQVQNSVKTYLANLNEDERIKLIASPTLNSVIEQGKQIIEDKRMEIMKSLTANIKDDVEKKAKLLKLKDKSLPQLKEILEFAVTMNVVDEKKKDTDEEFLNNFFGAAGANDPQNNARPKNSRPLVINSYIPGTQNEERVA